MEKKFADVWPIMAVEHDCIVSKKGDITVAYSVQLPEIFSLSNHDYESFHQAWIKAIKTLPKFCVFHKQDRFLNKNFRGDVEKESSVLSFASNRHFNERPFLEHKCWVFITKKPAGRKTSSSLFSTLIRNTIVPGELLKPQFLQDFLDCCGQFKRILEDTGLIELTRLTQEQIVSTARSAGILEQYCFLSETADEFQIKDIQFKDGITVGNQRCQLFTLGDAADLPALCGSRMNFDRYSTDKTKFSVGFSSTLGQLLPLNHIYNQYIFIEDAAKTLQRLESKRLRLQSLSAYSRENLISRDATNDFLNEAISEQRLPVRAHFNILAWSDNESEFKEIKSAVSSGLAQMDAVSKVETASAPQIFWAGLPGNAADFPVEDTFDTFAEQACCFLNLESSCEDNISPFGIRLGDRLTGKPLHVDISDWPYKKGIVQNFNKFILGPSGSGKSFFTNHMVRSYYEQGTHIVLVDVGHSYKGLCDMVNGYYFTYSEETPIKFNPFFIGEGDSLDTEKKESIKTLLLALWKKDDEEYRRAEYVALSNAIQLYYDKLEKHPEIFPGFNSFYEFLKHDFVAILAEDKVKDHHFDIDNFLYVLRPYYQGGEFDFLLNAKENLNLLQERFIVFELDSITGHPTLMPVVTIIIMEVFINKMRKLRGVRKMILIEEAWKALMKEGFAEYIKYLFKTVRKFFGEAIVVTQEVDDLLASPIVKQAIINNSDCKIMLDQSKYQNKFDQIQEFLGLTEKEKALVLSLNKSNDPKLKYKEVFISLGGTYSRVYRTEVSLEEYLAYTTDQREKVMVQDYSQRYGSIDLGIKVLASELRSRK
uniref:TraG family conjugative transposon ATPase n=1 Tax=Pedobacter schmidteae TaxID=2201271 RepID=UPI000EB12F67|nr:TraG family conjugative transposon ATPase [Pedobacter schmidteae]